MQRLGEVIARTLLAHHPKGVTRAERPSHTITNARDAALGEVTARTLLAHHLGA